MMRKLSLILAVLLALCGCAFAEAVQPAHLEPAHLEGLWNLEYVTSEGYMITTQGYGLEVTLSLNADGTTLMDYNGDVVDTMTWYLKDGRAYIVGYNPEMDVEMIIDKRGVLEITDEVGSMFYTRIVEEAE